MVLYKYLRTLPVHSSLSVLMPSEDISSAKREMSGLAHQDTWQNRKTINTTQGLYVSFYATKSFLSLIVSQSVSRRNGSMCWTRSIRPITEAWVLCHLSPPLPLHTVSRKYISQDRIFALIRKIYSPWNISALRYSSCRISGMFHLRETGCNGHVHIYGYCDKLRP